VPIFSQYSNSSSIFFLFFAENIQEPSAWPAGIPTVQAAPDVLFAFPLSDEQLFTLLFYLLRQHLDR
jgi:hypothetical protein